MNKDLAAEARLNNLLIQYVNINKIVNDWTSLVVACPSSPSSIREDSTSVRLLDSLMDFNSMKQYFITERIEILDQNNF